MIHLIKGLFESKNVAKSSVPFNYQDISAATETNRASLGLVKTWIDDEAFKKSWFQYGVPEFIKKEIDKSIGNNTTYSDIMLVIARNCLAKLNYLEIGVSVGKNFFQLLNAVKDATLTGFDIEDFNPIVEKRLIRETCSEWTTPDGSIKKSNSYLKTYRYQTNQVNYLCADVWDQNSWAKLEGKKFNMVFSDALHSPEAILFEFEMLAKYKLLDDIFVIIWDDLVGKMKSSFFNIVKRYNEQFNIQDIFLIKINGWVGEFEAQHSVGIISNFPLK